MPLSVQQAIRRRFPDADLSDGIRRGLSHPFYRSGRGRFPFSSVRRWMESLAWPDRVEYLGNHPHDSSTGWSDNLQGVTHDEQHWYITQQDRLWKFPVGHDLAAEIDEDDPGRGITSVGIPEALQDQHYDHFGDLDHRAGLLYVPVEGSWPFPLFERKIPGRIALFDAHTLRFLAVSPPLHADREAAPWCALHPHNGLLHTSQFTSDRLHVFEPRVATGGDAPRLELTALGDFELRDESGRPLRVHRIQGGVFSESGHLYLVSDTRAGGILGFDMTTGRRMLHATIDYDPSDPTGKLPEELEGITIWDLDGGPAPGIGGQLHVLMIDNDWPSDDELYFKHFRVSGGAAPDTA